MTELWIFVSCPDCVEPPKSVSYLKLVLLPSFHLISFMFSAVTIIGNMLSTGNADVNTKDVADKSVRGSVTRQ